jgi:hypothetical protein
MNQVETALWWLALPDSLSGASYLQAWVEKVAHLVRRLELVERRVLW